MLTKTTSPPVSPPLANHLVQADSMTAEELEAHRSAVRAALAPRGAMWRFSDSALGAAGATRAPPFAVVGSAAVDRGVGRFWPVRRYPWGRCEPLLTQHSELPALRRLLFESGYHEIKMQTEARYLRFRQKECNERSNPVPVSRRVPPSLQPAACICPYRRTSQWWFCFCGRLGDRLLQPNCGRSSLTLHDCSHAAKR